jgi:hypothetical protein
MRRAPQALNASIAVMHNAQCKMQTDRWAFCISYSV